MKSVLTAAMILGGCCSAVAVDTAYSEYVPREVWAATKQNPRLIMATATLTECEDYYRRGRFIAYRFEDEALDKVKTYGYASLDEDERKWATNVAAREGACMRLLDWEGKLTYLDQFRRWWAAR